MWIQREIQLGHKNRGFHLVTQEVEHAMPEISSLSIGLLNLFLQHTSASLSINENADPDVRRDLKVHMEKLAPDGAPHLIHTIEGPDDMPAHIKCALLGNHVTIPIRNGQLALGTWQGIYLGEHRSHGASRKILATLNGKT